MDTTEVQKSSVVLACKICKGKFWWNNVGRENSLVCPHCNAKYCRMPATERELFLLQDELTRGSNKDETLARMYKILVAYTISLLRPYRNRLHSSEQAKQVAHTATTLVLEGYCAKPGFSVWGSFCGLLRKKIDQAMNDRRGFDLHNYFSTVKNPKHRLDIVALDEPALRLSGRTAMEVTDWSNDTNAIELSADLENLIRRLTKVRSFKVDEGADFGRLRALQLLVDPGPPTVPLAWRAPGGVKRVELQFREYSRLGKLGYIRDLETVKHEAFGAV